VAAIIAISILFGAYLGSMIQAHREKDPQFIQMVKNDPAKSSDGK
jgi:hypothetical protein